MKKVLLSMGVVATLAMTSCGGIDGEAAAEEFCACSEMEGDEQTACHDEWIEKYKDAKATEEEATKMGEKMAECDLINAAAVLTKAQSGE